MKVKGTIGIYVGSLYFPKELMHKWDERNLYTGGIGGSEIWAIELAKQLTKAGYICVIFGDPEKEHVTSEGITYIPMEFYDYYIERFEFDYFIASRRINFLKRNIKSKKFFLMLHDPFILDAEHIDDETLIKISAIFVQSDFQKRLLEEKYPELKKVEGKIRYTFQGVDKSWYESQMLKKNKMVWSSHKIRGSRFLIEKIYPKIKKEVPDFEIDVCGYADDVSDSYFKQDGVNILGNVSKERLTQLQKESKIWIYPNFGLFENGKINDETFCITAVENALAHNALILADRTCFSTTLNNYTGFVGTELFKDSDILDNKYMEDFANVIAEQAIKLLKDESIRDQFAEDAYNICCNYTWENVAKTFLEQFDIPIKNNKRLILLTGVGFRPYNLDKIFASIKENLCSKMANAVTWVLCYDKYNCNTDISYIIDECKKYQEENSAFGWFLCPTGKPNQKNYGGDLFNAPLEYVSGFYEEDELWVYVLDDDNMIMPAMGSLMDYALNKADENNKNCILFNIVREDGTLAPMGIDYLWLKDSQNGVSPYYTTIDPSQIIIKKELIDNLGGYNVGYNYDITIWRFLIHEGQNNILFADYLLNMMHLCNCNTTHNALQDDDVKEKWQSILENDEDAFCYIGICNKQETQIFIVNRDKIKDSFKDYVI